MLLTGTHVSLGTGSEDRLKTNSNGNLETMANTTFAWMVYRCRSFLRAEEKVLSHIMSDEFDGLGKCTARHKIAQQQDPKLGETKYGWGLGPYQKDFEGIMSCVSGKVLRTPGCYPGKLDTGEYNCLVVFHAQQA